MQKVEAGTCLHLSDSFSMFAPVNNDRFFLSSACGFYIFYTLIIDYTASPSLCYKSHMGHDFCFKISTL